MKNQLITAIGLAALRCSCFAADSSGTGEAVYPPGGKLCTVVAGTTQKVDSPGLQKWMVEIASGSTATLTGNLNTLRVDAVQTFQDPTQVASDPPPKIQLLADAKCMKLVELTWGAGESGGVKNFGYVVVVSHFVRADKDGTPELRSVQEFQKTYLHPRTDAALRAFWPQTAEDDLRQIAVDLVKSGSVGGVSPEELGLH